MRMWWLALVVGCAGEQAPDVYPDPTCDGLYGRPAENTGLSEAQCAPEIAGDETWTAPVWDEPALDALRAWTLLDPPEPLAEDPYVTDPDAQPSDSQICGVLVQGEDTYRVQTFDDPEAAFEAGATMTHGGACGACSSLADLAVYAGVPDLTGPVRQCAILGITGTIDGVEQCLSDLGFTPACARIWAYNARHTQQECFDTCIAQLDDPYHLPDGTLNACLQCDEDESGPVFKTYAGRTRRNTGVPTALCRPCESVWRLAHDYGAD